MKFVFMGTPDFARSILHTLYDSEQEIVAVWTQPDKPKGRGYALTPSPVKTEALKHGTPVYQPTTLRDENSLNDLRRLEPDLIVVAAYGKILPEAVLTLPRFGCINIHASLLPRWRGAAPIQRAILAGDHETGVTAMQMEVGLDTGDMLGSISTPIAADDTFGSLHDRLAELGASLMLQTLEKLQNGSLSPKKQDEKDMTYAAKIEKAEARLNFNSDASVLDCKIRAFNPFPLAFTTLNGKTLKITDATPLPQNTAAPNGTITEITSDGWIVSCATGSLLIRGVLPEGKKRMTALDFLRGHALPIGTVLE